MNKNDDEREHDDAGFVERLFQVAEVARNVRQRTQRQAQETKK